VITVDRKVVEVGGRLYLEAPKNRKYRRTVCPRRTPAGYPLAERLAARIEEARAEQEAGTNPKGLIFPSSSGGHWRSSNFNRRILQPAYLKAGWRDRSGEGHWTWHSLRHVFCTTALFTWKLDATDVSRMAGHANYRITLDMYVKVPPPASSTAPAAPPNKRQTELSCVGPVGAPRPTGPTRTGSAFLKQSFVHPRRLLSAVAGTQPPAAIRSCLAAERDIRMLADRA